MKKSILFVLMIGIFILPLISAEQNCTTHEECDDDVIYTYDYCNSGVCENKLAPVIFLNFQMLGKLQEIFDKLQELVDIQNTPRECVWEKFNQQQSFNDISGSFGCCGWHSINTNFQAPLGISYSEVNVLGGRVLVQCIGTDQNCNVLVNGVNCCSIWKNTRGMCELSEECVNAIVSGKNDLTLSVASHMSGVIENMQLEMEVKPANC